MVIAKKTLELKKHVAVIHSANKLSLLQRKIANALLYNAYDELLEKDEYRIHIAELCKLVGYDSNDYKTIKNALINLLSTVIEWNLLDGDKLDRTGSGIWSASSIIADASIDGAICTYSYSNKMKKLLHHPELYGRLNMLIQTKFQSSYGLALYENCVRYQNLEQTPWLEMVTFRKLMGVEEGTYKVFRDLKNRVIDKAVDEVNKHSVMNITPHFKKQGRQVIAIQFFISPKEEAIYDLVGTSLSEKILKTKLKKVFGLSQRQVDEIENAYSESYIIEKISVIESSTNFVKGKIKNLAKYFLSALRDDYQPTKSASIQLEKTKEVDLKKRSQETMAWFNAVSTEEKNIILNAFEKVISRGSYSNIYQKEGLKNVLIKDQLSLFIEQNRSKFFSSVDS